MNLPLISSALSSAIYLLPNEIQGIENDLLKQEYEAVLVELESALAEIEKPGR